jgi:hypothetical protein
MAENDVLKAMAKATISGEAPKFAADTMATPEQLHDRVLKFQDKVAAAIGAKDGTTIADMTKAGGVPSVLRYVGTMRYIRNLVDLEHEACLKCANDEYGLLQPPKGALIVPCGFGPATFKKYTRPTKYIYPQDILAMEVKLKEAKKVAEVSGAAKQVPFEFNPEIDSRFSVSIA